MNKLYAEIGLPRKIGSGQETLTYEVPFELVDTLKKGDLVEIPLRNKNVRGVVLETHCLKPLFPTKAITRKGEASMERRSTRPAGICARPIPDAISSR